MSALLKPLNYEECQSLTHTGAVIEQCAARVAELDFTVLKQKLAKDKNWTPEQVDEVEGLYRKFLTLNLAYPSRKVCPNGPIDEFWHAHILDTAAYAQDCDRLFGGMLAHYPYFGTRGPEDAQALQEAFASTRHLFIVHFGVDITDGSASARGCSPQRCP